MENKYSENCLQQECDVNMHIITMNDVHSFFDIKNAKQCTTSIVYINGFDDPLSISKVMLKEVDEDCYLKFTMKNNFYYVYTRLIENMLLWSKHPKAFGIKGHMGNHVSIGPLKNKPNNASIHETFYSWKKTPDNLYDILWNKQHIFYDIDTINPKELITQQFISSHSIAQSLWDAIYCHNNSKQTGSG